LFFLYKLFSMFLTSFRHYGRDDNKICCLVVVPALPLLKQSLA
jgi:hypothetical protein